MVHTTRRGRDFATRFVVGVCALALLASCTSGTPRASTHRPDSVQTTTTDVPLPAGTTVHRATEHVVLADGSTLTPPPANAKPLIPAGLAWQAGGEGFAPCPKPAVATITFGVYAAVPAAYAVPAPDPSARRDGSPFQAWVLECRGVFVLISGTAGPTPAPAQYHDVIAVVAARTGENLNDM